MPEYVLILDTATGQFISKQAGASHIADSAIVSGKVGAAAVLSGSIASGQIGTFHMALGAVVSSIVGANVLATPHVQNQGILSASIGANVLATPHVFNQGILSASIGANVLDAAHIRNQGILSANIAANILGTPHIINQGILSASYGGASIAGPHFADYAIISGKVASGAINEAELASGISIDIAETVQEPTFRSAISGIAAYEAVMFMASGYFNFARATQSGRWPAVGLLGAAATSGSLATLLTFGRMTNAGWGFSGYEGSLVFLGTSSEVTRTAPSASGAAVQRLGTILADRTIMFLPSIFVPQVGQ